jgi:hypothetical protein
MSTKIPGYGMPLRTHDPAGGLTVLLINLEMSPQLLLAHVLFRMRRYNTHPGQKGAKAGS